MIEPERLDYDLTPQSLVWDVGAYRGEFSRAIGEKFRCRIMAFEPTTEYRIHTQGQPPHVEWLTFGLGAMDEKLAIPLAFDRTTAFPERAATHPAYHPGPIVPIEIRDVIRFMNDRLIENVDLAKINIEGGEYALLRRLIDAGYISRFRYLQVQFHTFMPMFGELYKSLETDLKRTHKLSWRRPFVWESWERLPL